MLSGGSIDDLESRARRVKDDAALRDRLVLNYVASREPYPLSPHIEERIYNGFPGQNDEARMAASIKPLGRITSRSCRASRMSGCGGSGFASFTSKHAHSFPRRCGWRSRTAWRVNLQATAQAALPTSRFWPRRRGCCRRQSTRMAFWLSTAFIFRSGAREQPRSGLGGSPESRCSLTFAHLRFAKVLDRRADFEDFRASEMRDCPCP
jgi:hypothetical protein